jgi:lysophospholipase L1-like esterase
MTNEWEPAIRAFEERDRTVEPPDDPVVFTGSSSIARWESLRRDFPDWPVLNRGFGGSQMSDLVFFCERIIIPYRPRMVIVYSGDNDLASGKSPRSVQETACQLIDRVRAEVSETRFAFLSVKYSPARLNLAEEIARLNDLLGTLAEEKSKVDYLDVASCLLNDEGKPVAGCYIEDGLHLSDEGYRRWTEVLLRYLREQTS